MRCDSTGELYPVTTSAPLSSVHVSLAAISPQLWHHRLGHPGDHVFGFLKKINLSLVIRRIALNFVRLVR